jgi:hypothetical protein
MCGAIAHALHNLQTIATGFADPSYSRPVELDAVATKNRHRATMPSFFIWYASVEGFTPNSSAAPSGPQVFPSAC